MKKIALSVLTLSVLTACHSTQPLNTTKPNQKTAQENIMTTPKTQTATIANQTDPHLWLEEVTGEKQLAWVKAHNDKADQALATTPRFRDIEQSILKILNSNEKIPYVGKRGEFYYNFWTDDKHKHGIWRRTTLAEFKKPNPKWEVLLDLDELNAKEGENWVWHGADCLESDYNKCIISLSRGGADADVSREFDLTTKSFVKEGFYRPEAKGGTSWIDENLLYLTNASEHEQTNSGYANTVKLWKRGTPIESAKTIYTANKSHTAVSAGFDETTGLGYVVDAIDFYNTKLFIHNPKTNTLDEVKDLPLLMDKGVYKEFLTLSPKEDWTIGGKTYKAGSYLVANLNDWQNGKQNITVLFEPTDSTSLENVSWTKNYVVLNVLDDVKSVLKVLSIKDFSSVAVKGLPQNGKLDVSAVDDKTSDELWLTVSGFTTPVSLHLFDVKNSTLTKLKSTPSFFKEEDFVVEQHFATSLDGTKVPYFLVHHKDMKKDGDNPTLLYGYGGFEVSLTPSYSGGVGNAWLSKTTKNGKHGVYVLANIRGGGEYGPAWHQAALKDKRHKAYEDFSAVAKDLIAKNITSPKRLGVQGGSNGGLLTGNMLTQYPDLFGAVVIQVPLLDMSRYHKLLAGASWVAEYGDPDKADEWAYIKSFSPYHLFDDKKAYPPVLLTTSTRDDRVHPAHARKMMAKLSEAGKVAYYYENIEGGHGGAANNEQRAYMSALAYEFLWQTLGQ
ncbi:prolyl oligopeptidase family serine peptidase [Moraxella nasicaprae]|uniref:Prolyl oligopeptidase family serine peptidase n=1 Tax=Moraxella nasicaprae TaxID=2904122 RepID=A0ABY6F4P5_9GAMM|nr:prolyl oligopeptidase family serine peptidase [Moraxella nasicaprae]UXZ05014.1 prolyl oligopeptidase family serine peptidase [Moraxella nasicaprae]